MMRYRSSYYIREAQEIYLGKWKNWCIYHCICEEKFMVFLGKKNLCYVTVTKSENIYTS